MSDTPPNKKLSKATNAENPAASVYKLAIEIIFGVIIGVSFTDYNKVLVPFALNFENVLILVGYITVLASLVGYSITIIKREHKNVHRFAIDLFLVFLYYELIYSPKHSFEFFLSVFPWIFGGYLIWQVFEWYEYRGQKDVYSGLKPKLTYSLPNFFISLGIWIYYDFFYQLKAVNFSTEESSIKYDGVTHVEWILLGITLANVLGFRIYPWVKRYLKERKSGKIKQ